MTRTQQSGWVLIAAMVATAMIALSNEVKMLESWQVVLTPGFIGNAMGHVGPVILSALGGRLLAPAKTGQG